MPINPPVSGVELREKLLQKIGGWQAVKEARGIHAAGKVLSAKWSPPELTGEVQGGAGVLKSGLLIKDHINVDNLCTCKESGTTTWLATWVGTAITIWTSTRR